MQQRRLFETNTCTSSTLPVELVATFMIRKLSPVSREVRARYCWTHAAEKTFTAKNFANSHKTSKFAKVFSLESSRYTVLHGFHGNQGKTYFMQYVHLVFKS